MKKQETKKTSSSITEAFDKLSKKDNYKLTKTKSKRSSMVFVGESVQGKFTLLEHNDAVMLLVDNSAADNTRFSDPTYIRTSPIVNIVDNTKTSVTFETEGGFYQIEKIEESK